MGCGEADCITSRKPQARGRTNFARIAEAAILLEQRIQCSCVIAVPSLYIAEVIRSMDLACKLKIIIGHTSAVVEQADAA